MPASTAVIIAVVQAKQHLAALRREIFLAQSGNDFAGTYALLDLLQTDLKQIEQLGGT